MAKPNYHDTIAKESLSAAKLGWIGAYLPRRVVEFELSAHYHPYSDELIEQLNLKGLDALLDARFHASLTRPLVPTVYDPGGAVKGAFPKHEIDVSDDGPYAIYNWELLFHAPLLIATHLSKNQRFAEAQHWFHYIFDPTSNETDVDAPQRFWKFLRFREETDPQFIGDLLTKLAEGTDTELRQRMEKAITAWRDRPFRPHVIARTRALAYQLNVIMKYLDNLIAWGDFLFMQDTIESMNEATQIYVLAANVLGPKPQTVPPRGEVARRSYAQLKADGIDAFANALVELENEFPFDTSGVPLEGDSGTAAAFGIGRALYFCIPANDQFLAYWDRVADRLFKLRHCMNIEGIVRQPALFDPPIDPGALVRAVAGGLDIASIVNNINQPVSHYRGTFLLRKAEELCAEVKSLGAATLTAIEKHDAEALVQLRLTHEMRILGLVREIRYLQWKEAEAATEALVASRATVWERFRHYKRILGAGDDVTETVKAVELMRNELSEETFDAAYAELVAAFASPQRREAYRKETSVGGLLEFAGEQIVSVVGGELGTTLPLNKNEHAELNIFLPTADKFALVSTIMNIAAPILSLIPQFGAAAKPMGVGAEVGFGGQQLSKGAEYAALGAQKVADAFKGSAERASKMAGYYRRAEDYVFQANVATSELEQYGRQIVSSLIREQILRREYENQLAQIEHAEEVAAFHAEKFTTTELYSWMQAELSRIHYDAYKLAFDLAKRTEATLAWELMRPEFDDLHVIGFNYWDGGRKGLLAAEQLSLDLKRLELAFLDHDRREYELTKHVSLARLDPRALLKLRATGSCEVTIPEWMFDLDTPGQFMRRIKSVAVTIPAVTGPQTSIHAKLSLLRSSVRMSSLLGDQYQRVEDGEDGRFRDFSGAIQSVITSSAQNDSGLFEVNLRDERHLPFEGAGAISTWRIELSNATPQFDLDTISDVVFHVRYTAREAGHLAVPATDHLTQEVLVDAATSERLFTLPYDFAGPWTAFRDADNNANRVLDLAVETAHFPYWVRRLGMSDDLVATFAVTDKDKRRLSIAPATVALDGNAQDGWTLHVDNASDVFAFLTKYRNAPVMMTVSFAAA